MPRPLPGALLCLAAVSACRSAATNPDHAPAETPADRARGAQASSAAEQAVEAIRAGELERARDLLDGLLLQDWLARARATLAAGEPADALTLVDRALSLETSDPAVRLLKADASLRLAEAKIESGGGSAGLIEGVLADALDYYRSVPESAHAVFGASRAAWLLNRPDEALELARRGVGLRASGDTDLGALDHLPERIYAEQVYSAYARARAAEEERADALFVETEDALSMLLGRERDDPWTWSRLSDLHEWEGRLDDARGACERGLERVPEDVGLLERLARVSRAAGGAAAAVGALEAYVARHPDVAAGHWQLAVARFHRALEGYKAEPRVLDVAPFAASEQEFQALGERHPEYAQGALGYRIVARLARGWCRFHAGELAAAEETFLSMNELVERGVEWALPGELQSGIMGLFFVADALVSQEKQVAAGEIFETLVELQPGEYLWANNAGLNLRDAAENLERRGGNLCLAARGRITNAEALAELRALVGTDAAPGSEQERADFLRAANADMARARELMQRSWKAYEPAAELVPDDIRVVNDAALILVYFLHHDLERAERWLLHCVELGRAQVEAKRAEVAAAATPEEREAREAELDQLTEAWGDAHQNLGVLEWVHRKNRAAAEAWLVKSVEIWPLRQPVTNSLLPQVRGELAPEEDDTWDLLHWAEPCQAR